MFKNCFDEFSQAAIAAAGEKLEDRSALVILDQRMRDAGDAAAVDRSKRTLLSGAKFVSPSVGTQSAQLQLPANLDGFELTVAHADSLTEMIRERTLRKREKLVAALPITSKLLRGTLLERVVRHKSGCPKCARGEGHQVYVLKVSYGRGQTQQISVRRERVAEVRRWLDNYQKLKEAIEHICELNHDLLRPDPSVPHPGRKRRGQLRFADHWVAEEVADLERTG